jgi:IS30 family transposase
MNKLAIAERRRKVASLLVKSMSEAEIARAVGGIQPTISRDNDDGNYLYPL